MLMSQKASAVLELDEILSVNFCENFTRASIDIGVSSQWVKFQFWVNFPFKSSATSALTYDTASGSTWAADCGETGAVVSCT